MGEAFLLTVGAFLLTAELLYLQSIEVLFGHTLPIDNVSKRAPIVSRRAPTVSKKLKSTTVSKEAQL